MERKPQRFIDSGGCVMMLKKRELENSNNRAKKKKPRPNSRIYSKKTPYNHIKDTGIQKGREKRGRRSKIKKFKFKLGHGWNEPTAANTSRGKEISTTKIIVIKALKARE
jgi:hypothetical protein